MFASPASADPSTTQPATEPTSRPAVDELDHRQLQIALADLASPDPAVREAARARLIRLHRDQLPELIDAIKTARPLAPAQTVMLRQIVQEVYLSGEEFEKDATHGFLGILMDNGAFGPQDIGQQDVAPPCPGVVVADRFPGFCASRMLRDGDVILGTSQPAQVFNSPADLKYAISTLDPGTVVHLKILRQGQVIDVPLTLDSRPVEADTFDAAQNFRLRRAAKFNDYWEHTFVPLLKQRVG